MANLAWHFTGNKLRDGSSIPAVGQKLIFKGGIEICSHGYHWSKQPYDALQYAPGTKLHLVEYGGIVQEQEDKGCSSERTILKSIDATTLLRRFAADQALSVAYLWNMPDVVREYLTTLDEKLRVAAYAAAAYAYAAADYAAAASYAADAASYAATAAADYACRAARADYAARAAADADTRKDFNNRVYKAFNMEVTQ